MSIATLEVDPITDLGWPEVPFDVVSCSWPRPVRQVNGEWASDPEWDAPAMPFRPDPRWATADGERCWMIDWREFFRSFIRRWHDSLGGEMRGFHVVFELRMRASGTLVFWDDDGSIVRRNGRIVHADRSAHALKRNEIAVEVGDRVHVAQWQHVGGWLWGARIAARRRVLDEATERLRPYAAAAAERMASPNGPPLKMYVHGKAAVRTAVGLFSLILNGYRPSEVLLFGEEQWPAESRAFFAAILPFARVVPHREVLDDLAALGVPRLVPMATQHWFVMKTCVAMLCGPSEFCLMDDDVFILDALDDALSAFRDNDLVFIQDWDHGAAYQQSWLPADASPRIAHAGRMNAGLYWARVHDDRRRMAEDMLGVDPASVATYVWEQGFIASRFAGGRSLGLSTQRYFYPLFDGLPGGVLAYDYRNNPSGFASIHFGGPIDKPSEAGSLALAPEILDRSGARPSFEAGKTMAGDPVLPRAVDRTGADPYFGGAFEQMGRSLPAGDPDVGLGMTLFSLAVSARAASIVAIGDRAGWSTPYLASALRLLDGKQHGSDLPALRRTPRVLSIRPKPTREAASQVHEADLDGWVEMVDTRPGSRLLPTEPPDLLFIDGDGIEERSADVERYVQHVRPGGYVVLRGHFGSRDGGGRRRSRIERIVDELVRRGRHQRLSIDGGSTSLVVLRKRQRATGPSSRTARSPRPKKTRRR